MDIRSDIESWFPNIIGNNFKIIKTTGDFNCVSYTLDIFDGWMWTNTEIWPYKEVPRNLGLNSFKMLYNIYGYVKNCISEKKKKKKKIAFYSKDKTPTHACKQYRNIWRSKLGPSVIIEHELDWICGYADDAYGEVAFIMKRGK